VKAMRRRRLSLALLFTGLWLVAVWWLAAGLAARLGWGPREIVSKLRTRREDQFADLRGRSTSCFHRRRRSRQNRHLSWRVLGSLVSLRRRSTASEYASSRAGEGSTKA
jgi:hypothetical protein